MRKLLICLVVFLLSELQSVTAQKYLAAQIPAELKGFANAVIRADERQIIINSENNMVYRVKRVVTILDKGGSDFTSIHVPYNKSRKIRQLHLNIYNEYGVVTGKVKQSDFKDESYISDFSLFEDDRVKVFRLPSFEYPVTLELEFELQISQTLIIPDWFPQPAEDVSVQYATLEIVKNPAFELKYTGHGIKALTDTIIEGKKELMRWRIENLKARKTEPFSRIKEEILPNLKFTPVKFSYEGITGTYTDWKSYGSWVYNNLLKGRDDLPLSTQEFIKELVKNTRDKREAAKMIYEYAQKKNRYISVQIGIGGFMPVKASEVDAVSYGDCKALCNYVKALLKVAGITSYYTEVNAGTDKINLIDGFPGGGQSNHIILCIPFESETIWLECTSKDAPFGYLGSFTQDRNVLVIKEDGGYIMRTPLYKWDGNLQIRSANFTLDVNGNLSGEVKTIFSDVQSENRKNVDFLSPVEKETYLKEIFPFPNLNLEKYQLDRNIDNYPKTAELAQVRSREYVISRGPYYQFDLNPMNVSNRQLREVPNRNNEICINVGYTDTDSLVFNIPDNFKVENLPVEVGQSYDFGTYEFKARQVGSSVVVFRKMVLKEGNYPAEQYKDLVMFYKTAHKYDRAKCMMRKLE